MMQKQQGIYRERPYKRTKITLAESSRGISIIPSSNSTASSPPSSPGSKRKAIPELKSDDEFPTGIGIDYDLYTLVIDGYFKNGDVSGVIGSMNGHTYY